jgi:hypothetical protein
VGEAARVRLTSGAGRVGGPVSAAGCGREREERGSTMARCRHAGLRSTEPGGAV